MNKLILKLGEYDWCATRLTPRKYYPPKAQPESDQPWEPSRFDPGAICIPGIEGIGIQFERCLVARLAIATPFSDTVRLFAKHRLCKWNDVFNTWDTPILSQSAKNALEEIWGLIEAAFFDLPWGSGNVEIHWNYAISDKSLNALQKRITALNNFWDFKTPEIEIDIIYRGLSQAEIEAAAIESLKELPFCKWEPHSKAALNRLCVNYLRHRQSSYHVLLQSQMPHLRAFGQVNRAIAQAYPWLEEEALRQIGLVRDNHNKAASLQGGLHL